MNNKVNTFSAESDISTIDINVDNSCVCIINTNQKLMTVDYTESPELHIAASNGQLIIKHDRRPFSLLRKKTDIKIYVPEHLLPSATFHGDRSELDINGGIYAHLEFSADSSMLSLSDTLFDSCDIKGSSAHIKASNLTVKNNLLCSLRSGEALLENCFASHMECINKHGNLGAVNLKCNDSLFTSEQGNVCAIIAGNKEDFNITVNARKGTCNCESDEGKSNCGTLKAFAGNGNIMIEFVKIREEAKV